MNTTQSILSGCMGAAILATPAQARVFAGTFGAGFSIPDNDPAGAQSSIVAPAMPFAYSLTVTVAFPITVAAGAHPWIGDLVATLTFAPDDGGPVLSQDLFRRVGATSPTSHGDSSDMRGTFQFSNVLPTSMNLWDAAAAAGPSAPVAPGAYMPSTRNHEYQYQPLNFADAFGYTTGPGTWTLNISDHATSNVGAVLHWQLDSYVPAPGPSSAIIAFGLAGLRRVRRLS